jgi:hypothetical protein
MMEDLIKENEELKNKISELEKEKRKYLSSFGELVDRLTIVQLKEFLITEHRDEYSLEIKDILHDIDLLIKEKNVQFSAEMIRLVAITAIINREIWLSEANCRNGVNAGNDLVKSHSLNSIRCTAKNKMQSIAGGRKDYKIDVIQQNFQFVPSW